MKETLLQIIKKLVSKPDEVVITESLVTDHYNNDIVKYSLKVSDEDTGLIIGKSGKTIRSITDLIRIRSIKSEHQSRFTLVVEKDESDTSVSDANISSGTQDKD